MGRSVLQKYQSELRHDDARVVNGSHEEQLGRGRSGTVYRERNEKGRELAKKVFSGEGLSTTWCEAAVRSAMARRKLLTHLVRYWFSDDLRLPRTDIWSWDQKKRAFAIWSELIEGSHAPLPNPFERNKVDHLQNLVTTIMKPLQARLMEAGFDGLVWQAGLGNPVASNNFMLEKTDTGKQWVWIDLESGVPALFALNPLATLRFYLPKSFKHGRPLFDEVDVEKLRGYLGKHRADIEKALGAPTFAQIMEQVDELASRGFLPGR